VSAQLSPLERIGQLAIAEQEARRDRAKARTALTKARRAWMENCGEFFDPKEQWDSDDADAQQMLSALKSRDESNKALRLAQSRLRYAIAKAGAPA
jgi:hypothetical protein